VFRFIDKLMRGDVIRLRTRRPHPELHAHDGEIHTVKVQEVRNEREYFVECLEHHNTNWVNIHTDVTVWWDEAPDSIKENPVHRYKVTLANFITQDDTTATFQVEHEEFVHARSFEKVIEAYPKGEYGYLMMANRDTKERMVWEYDRARVVNHKAREILLTRRPVVKSVCFSGHRPAKLPGRYDNLQHVGRVWLHQMMRAQLMELQPKKVITGGALGIDQEAFDIAWELMEKGLIEEVWMYLPCRGQESKWPSASQVNYRARLDKAEARGWVKYIHDGPYPGAWCLQKRNVAMVDDTDAVIAIWDGSDGGTKNCRDYALSKNKKVMRINPKDAPSAPTKVAQPDRFEEVPEGEVRKSGVVSFKGAVRFGEGPAGAGFTIKDPSGKLLDKYGFSIGRTSINVADYRALIAALDRAHELGLTDIEIRSSAGAILQQLETDGCSDSQLAELYGNALDRLTYFRTVLFTTLSQGQEAEPEILATKAHK
jgi:uncharacterized phage-like protein YoqJ